MEQPHQPLPSFPNLLIIGIIGGIGSGKTTVSNLLQKKGSIAIHADPIAHSLLQQPEIQQQLTTFLGQDILNHSPQQMRKKIAQKVFSQPQLLQKLNQLMHPKIYQTILNQLQQLQLSPPTPYQQNQKLPVTLDLPLLLQSPFAKICNEILFVDTPQTIRKQRVQKNRNWNKHELQQREKYQLPLKEKKQQSTYILQNHSNLENLQQQVENFWLYLQKKYNLHHPITPPTSP